MGEQVFNFWHTERVTCFVARVSAFEKESEVRFTREPYTSESNKG